jgi:integrase
MARGGLRIDEVLKLRFGDVQDRKLIILDPKSGKEKKQISPAKAFIFRLLNCPVRQYRQV